MSKKRNLFAGLICLVIAFVCLVSCVPVSVTPEQAAKTQAETDAQEVLGKIVWDDEDREAITSSLSFPTENKNYPGVHIEWETSEEDVIAKNGKVTLLYDNDPRAYELKPEDDEDETKVIKVIVTATVYADYTWEDNGTQSASTDPISKQFEFTVFAMPENTDQGTIKEVKDRAWNFFYVENETPKTLTTYQAKYYSVFVKGVVVGKLNGDTKGFFINDGTDTIYVYGSNSSYQIGSKVQVFGQVYVYYGNLQIGSKVSTSFTTDVDVQPLEYERITPDKWNEQNKGLSDEVIGRFGGRALEVEGYLEEGESAASDKYKLVDPSTGVVSWVYYKSYDKNMEAELQNYLGKYVVLTGISYARDSRANANQLLWTGKIEETEAPVVSDETKVDVALQGITLKDAYTADFDLSDKGVWEVVSGTGIEIAEGVAKVTRTEEDQVVVLKVTVTSGEVSKSKEFTITIKKVVVEKPFEVGKAYNFGLEQANLGKTLYLTGEMDGFYYAVTEDLTAAATVYVEQAEGGYNLKLVKVDGTVLYMDIILNGTYINVVYVETPSTPFAYNADLGTFTKVVDGKERLFGTSGTYTTMSPNAVDKEGVFVGKLYKIASNEPFETDYAYKFEVVQGNTGKTLYLTGNYVNTYYGESTTDLEAAADVYVVKAEGGYNLKLVKVDGTVLYINLVTSGTHINIKFEDAASTVWNYNEELETFTTLVNETEYYIGTYGTYESISPSSIDKAASSFVGQLVDPENPETPHEHKYVDGKCECGAEDPNYVEPGNPTFGVVTEFEENVAYKFGLVQGNTNKTLYLTGNYKNTYYGESTEDLAAAASVYVVATEGGYNLKLVKVDGTVLYINLVTSGTHINIKFEDAASTVWNYNEELETFTTLVNETEYYIGTYGTYDSISPSSIDKAVSSFVGHLYGDVAGDVTPHEHKYVDGKCECGEVDPDYVAPQPPVGGALVEGQAYVIGAANSKGTLYFNGTQTNGRFNGVYVKAEATKVYVELVDGNFKLYFLNGETKTYIVMGDSSTGGSFTTDAAAATVFEWNAEKNTLAVAEDSNNRAFGVNATSTYDNFSCYDLSGAYNWGQFLPADGETPEPPVHEHKYVDGKCECGEVDPDYVAPQPPVGGALVEGQAYVIGAANSKGTLYFNGTQTNGRFNGVYVKAEATKVYVELVDGNFKLYFLNGETKTYIVMGDSSTGGSFTTDAAAATVFEWNAEKNTLAVAEDSNNRAFGVNATSTYDNFSCYDLSGAYNWGQFEVVA